MDSTRLWSSLEMARDAKRPMAAHVSAGREYPVALCTRRIRKSVSLLSENLIDQEICTSFNTQFDDSSFCYTVRERTMLALINTLTDMPDWGRQIFNPDFTIRWKSELLMTGKDVTRSMADWVGWSTKLMIIDVAKTT